MKKLFFLIVLVAMISACTTKPKYVITGNIQGADSGMALLQQRVSGRIVTLDSAEIKNGAFKMDGVIDYPKMAILTLKGIDGARMFFIENSKISISGNKDSLHVASVTGSATNSELEAYRALFSDLYKQYDTLYGSLEEAQKANNKTLVDSLQNIIKGAEQKEIAISKDYIASHPASYVTPVVFGEISYILEVPEIESILNSLDTVLNKVPSIKSIKERLPLMKAVQVGQKAPDFTLNDVNGIPVTLSAKFNGKTKLLLIDFWASWCGPCRGENPNVVKVWKEFNKKGFDIIGVSLDYNGEKWKNAIADDQLTWTQLSDLKYWNCVTAQQYAVNSIPSNFLLDGNGIIIAHNLRGDDLYNKVEEILSEKK